MRRRIGGLVSTESVDADDETLLQDGLDFEPFLEDGYFNDDHAPGTTDVLGYPEMVRRIEKGDTLPDGTVAPAKGTWAEGSLLEGYPPADKIWDLARSLAKTGGKRRIGFSIEGKVLQRAGAGGKTVAAARITDVAITRRPKNKDTSLAALAKSLRVAGEAPPPSVPDPPPNARISTLSRAQAVLWAIDNIAGITPDGAARFVDAVRAAKARQLL